jgi:hypothetical protein
VSPHELLTVPPKQDPPRKKRKTLPTCEATSELPHTDNRIHDQPQVPTINQQIPTTNLQVPSTGNPQELDFTVFVECSSGLILRVGSVYFVESCSVPFVISRIFKSNLQSTIIVTCSRCVLSPDKCKIIGVCSDFECNVNPSYFVRTPTKGEFLFHYSKDSFISKAQLRVLSCQQANLGNVCYLRDLRCHALGAQMRQAVVSGISLSATKPPQATSLGPFEPLHDMAVFGLSDANSFKVKYEHSDLYKLDSVLGSQWDVKQRKADTPRYFFKFVTTATVYLCKKTFILKFNFTFAQSTFPLTPEYRLSCKALFK